MIGTLRRFVLPVVFLAVGLPAGVGAVMAMGHYEPPDEGVFTPVLGAASSDERRERRAQGRWEPVATIDGSGSARTPFVIADRAIQWKADWRCETGRFRMSVDGPAARRRVLADADCPARDAVEGTDTGMRTLRVSGTGAWRAVISQQVDTALNEPPLAGMTSDALVATGRFHGIQKQGEGSVSLYRLDNGRLALRLEDFYTTPSPRLQIWLSSDGDPRSTLDARAASHVSGGSLRSTLGSYNQMLPEGTDPKDFRSIVIWCPTVLIAFSAAPLTAP